MNKEMLELQAWLLGLGNQQLLFHFSNCKECNKKWEKILSHYLKIIKKEKKKE